MQIYMERNNILVKKWYDYTHNQAQETPSICKSFLDLWKEVTLASLHNGIPLTVILASSCNLVLTNLMKHCFKAKCSDALKIGYITFKTISRCKTIFCVKNESCMIDVICAVAQELIDNLSIANNVGSLIILLCTLLYLASKENAILELVKNMMKRKSLFYFDNLNGSDEPKNCYILLPSSTSFLSLEHEETNKVICEFIELIMCVESTAGHAFAERSIPHVKLSYDLSLYKYTEIRTILSSDIKLLLSQLLNASLDKAKNKSYISCLIFPTIAANLANSSRNLMAIKLLSLSLKELADADTIPISQISSLVSLANQFHVIDEPQLRVKALQLAGRYIHEHIISEEERSLEVEIVCLSLMKCLAIPHPNWVKHNLARTYLCCKRYTEAVAQYWQILNGSFWYHKSYRNEEAGCLHHPFSFEVLLHEYALSLFLSDNLDQLRYLAEDLPTRDFIMLCFRSECYKILKSYDHAAKVLNRAILELECSDSVDSFIKISLLDIFHSKLEDIVVCLDTATEKTKYQSESQMLDSSVQSNANLSNYPFCSCLRKTSPDELSQNLAICHLLHPQ